MKLTADPGFSTIGGNKAVASINDYIRLADHDTVAQAGRIVGITQHAIMPGATGDVQVDGVMTEPSWSWSHGPIFLGNNGNLTQTPPTTGFLLRLGRAVTATSILIGVQEPVILS